MILEKGKPNIKEIVVQTRLGNGIDNRQNWDKIPQSNVTGCLKTWASFINDESTRRVNEESGIYNCHGLTFASRRTNLDDRDIIKILNEDYYQKVDNDEVNEGDVAIYVTNEGIIHSGIVIGILEGKGINIKKPLILSKWGMMGEYIHRFDCCPPPYEELYENVMYYRIRNEKRNKKCLASSDTSISFS